jgi:hypothetical protein
MNVKQKTALIIEAIPFSPSGEKVRMRGRRGLSF